MAESLNVVMCANRAYLPHLEAALTSIRKNLNPAYSLSVTLLTRDLSESRIRWTNRGSGDSVRCVCPLINSLDILPVGAHDHVSIETYFRLYIDLAFDDSVTRVVYLDSDLVVLGDIAELARNELHGKVIGAVRDMYIKNCGMAFSAPSSDIDQASKPYFNAGVMIIDLEEWRKKRVRERALAFIRLNHTNIRWWDQDALNFVLLDEWAELDPRWNRTSSFWWLQSQNWMPPEELLTPYIVHFAGHAKPWRNYRHPDKRVYEHYLCLAGYGSHRLSLWKAIAFKIRDKLLRRK